jgi:micrococcal nuclease
LGAVDSDTLRVEWEGTARAVRLIDVDPESATAGGAKPCTAFGRRTLRWIKEAYLPDVTEVLLEFPADETSVSNSGKLLCYVFVRGDNFNVRLVREGWSPVFQKYGAPRLHRCEMEDAELRARMEGRGIWGGQGGRGDYAALKSYWQLRAGQISCFRLANAMGEDILNCRLHYPDIVGVARAKRVGNFFVELVRAFHRPDNGVIIQLGSPAQPFTAFFPPTARDLAGFLEREFMGFGRPNYVYVSAQASLNGEYPQVVIEHAEQVTTCPPNTLK